jgi:hypothetical protein
MREPWSLKITQKNVFVYFFTLPTRGPDGHFIASLKKLMTNDRVVDFSLKDAEKAGLADLLTGLWPLHGSLFQRANFADFFHQTPP